MALSKDEIYFFEPRKQLVKGEKSMYIVIASYIEKKITAFDMKI
ncbi:MAG: hypothetical protein RR324_10125 [Cellulosilyticaceae bacterium]